MLEGHVARERDPVQPPVADGAARPPPGRTRRAVRALERGLQRRSASLEPRRAA